MLSNLLPPIGHLLWSTLRLRLWRTLRSLLRVKIKSGRWSPISTVGLSHASKVLIFQPYTDKLAKGSNTASAHVAKSEREREEAAAYSCEVGRG